MSISGSHRSDGPSTAGRMVSEDHAAWLAGTYRKTWTGPSFRSFGFRDEVQMVLYLLPTGRFLYVGCWPGHERSAGAGTWSLEGDLVHLRGNGIVGADTLGTPGHQFNVTYLVHQNGGGRQLRGLLGHWSLLSLNWDTPLVYLGRVGVQFHERLCSGFPETWQAIDARATHFLEEMGWTGSAEDETLRTSAEEPARVTVSPAGDGDYSSIAAAVAESAPGTIVLIHPGLYAGPVHIDKNLELLGYGPVGSIIMSAHEDPCVVMTGGGATLRNITIRQEADDVQTDAVQLLAGRGWLGGCDVRSRGVGIRVSSDGPWTVQGCRVHGCGDVGIVVHGSGSFILEDCDLFDNRASGIQLSLNGEGNFGVRLSRLNRNGTFGLLLECGDGYVEYTEISENGQAGIHIEGSNSRAALNQNQVRCNRGSGVEAVARGEVYSRGNIITQNQGAGLLVKGEGTMATTKDDRFDGNQGGSGVTRDGAILIPS